MRRHFASAAMATQDERSAGRREQDGTAPHAEFGAKWRVTCAGYGLQHSRIHERLRVGAACQAENEQSAGELSHGG